MVLKVRLVNVVCMKRPDVDTDKEVDMSEKFEEVVEDLKEDIIESQKDQLGHISRAVKKSDNPREKLRKEISKKDQDGKPGELVEKFWQEEEISYLLDKRKEMGNDELEEFFQGNSELHEMDFNPFSRTEEKLIIQNYQAKTPEELAEMLEREERVVKLKLNLMGLDQNIE